MTETNVGKLIQHHQTRVGLSDEDLGSAVGYKAAVLVMLRNGIMRLPVNKVAAFAAALEVSHTTLLQAVLRESAPGLWDAIAPLMPLGELSQTEQNLLRHLRRLSNGRAPTPMVIDGAGVIALVVTT